MLACACNAAALVFWSPENKLAVENVALGCERKGRIQMILQYEFKGCRVLFIYSYKAESQPLGNNIQLHTRSYFIF